MFESFFPTLLFSDLDTDFIGESLWEGEGDEGTIELCVSWVIIIFESSFSTSLLRLDLDIMDESICEGELDEGTNGLFELCVVILFESSLSTLFSSLDTDFIGDSF